MSRDWDHELNLVRQKIKNASSDASYAESMDCGAALVREWIRAKGFDRAMAQPSMDTSHAIIGRSTNDIH